LQRPNPPQLTGAPAPTQNSFAGGNITHVTGPGQMPSMQPHLQSQHINSSYTAPPGQHPPISGSGPSPNMANNPPAQAQLLQNIQANPPQQQPSKYPPLPNQDSMGGQRPVQTQYPPHSQGSQHQGPA